jgi:hypothetical protein
MGSVSLDILNKDNLPRQCGTCTKCCEGYLTADINGYDIYPGQPCYLLKKDVGCQDYDNRPDFPCKSFECFWILEKEMPEEFKPSISGSITQYRNEGGFEFLLITYAGKDLDVRLLTWSIIFCKIRNFGIVWAIDNNVYWNGSDEFCTYMFEGAWKNLSLGKK